MKQSGRLVIVLKTSAQRERRNNATSLNLLKLNSLSGGIFFFRSVFAVHMPGAAKLFLIIVSETIFWHLKAVNQQILCTIVDILPV